MINKGWPKSPRVRLNQETYAQLQRRVLKRDGWRCQVCGSMENLQIHHKTFRSHSGHDAEENLIILCVDCHEKIHTPKREG